MYQTPCTYILRIISLGVLSVLSFNSVSAQTAAKDTLQLPAVVISANRFDLSDADRAIIVREIRTSDLMPRAGNSLGSAMTLQHTAAVRSYGPGAQTLSLLGFSGAQVQVMWNGQALNHAMLGLVDFSIIPASLFGSVRVNTSQVSAETGGNAIGGMIELMANSESGSNQELSLALGAFGARSIDAGFQIDRNRVRIRLSGMHHTGKNNYPYTDIMQSPPQREKRTNAEREINGILGDLQVRATSSVHKTAVWLNTSDAGIPGSIVASTSRARQFDQTMRINHRSDFLLPIGFTAGAGFYGGLHQLDYRDGAIGLQSLSRSYTAGGGVDVRRRANEFQWRTGVGMSWSHINSSEYSAPDRTHGYVQVNGAWHDNRRMFLFPSVRLDGYSDFGSAWSASLGGTYWFIPNRMRMMSSISSNFSPPTFNDLYWPGLGNPDLVAERSYRIDIGTEVGFERSRLTAYVFNNQIHNGIQWLPDDRGRFRPENILALRSRGVSLQGTSEWLHLDRHKFWITAGGTLTRVIYLKPRFAGDPGVGNQLRYQPLLRATMQVRYTWADFLVRYDLEYTGKRYLSESNLSELPHYAKSDVGLGYQLRGSHTIANISITIDNLFNTSYSHIQWYPMPGRHLNFVFSIRHNESKTN
jgi:vitamin B12 transporter